jgi:diguanylate cyclase (GGDEF)-like protein
MTVGFMRCRFPSKTWVGALSSDQGTGGNLAPMHRKASTGLRGTGRREYATRAVLVAAMTLAGSVSAHAAAPDRPWTSLAYPPAFEHISVEQGLSQSSVHAIAQDKKGFLWMGTDAGLNRYDGFRFETFHPEKHNPRSLAGDWIERIMPDRHGYLWIAARNAGLTLLDAETLAMVQIPISLAPGGLPARTVNTLLEDRDGNIWVGTEAEGLFRVDRHWVPPAQPRFEKLGSADAKGAPAHRVSALFLDRAGGLWLASPDRGLGRLASGREQRPPVFDYFPHDPDHRTTSAPEMVNAIAEDPFGKLWLGADDGLFIFDPASASFTFWLSSEYPSGVGRVTDVLRDTKDTLWVAADGLGLFKALPRAGRDDRVRFEHFAHDAKDPASLSRNGLQCLLEDTSGQLWVSAYQGGLNKIILRPGGVHDRERPSIFQYRNNAADPWSLSGDTISAIGEDRFGNLWVGTDGFGVNRLAAPKAPAKPARFERFRGDPTRAPGSLQTDVILTTHLDAGKQLWLGSYMGGLIRVDQDSATARPRFTHFRHDSHDPDSLSSDFVRDIVDDGQGGFWIACDSGGGMNHFDPRTGKAKRYNVGAQPGALKNANLMRMVKDRFGTLWIATQLGLHRFNPATEEFRVYDPGGPDGPSDVFINTVYLEPASDILWVGTKSGGLNRTEVLPWDGPPPRFSVYGKAEGLPGEDVMSILPDSKGDLWLATHRALCRFDTRTRKRCAFTFQRELRRAEFIWNAAHLGTDGEMFFGSNDGLTVFHPDDIVPNPIPPVLAFTDFRVRNQPLPLRARMTDPAAHARIPEIVLAPGESMFSLEFAALHFAAPDQNQYAYRLEGLDPGWNEIGNRHSVAYSALAPGDYVLGVRASNCDGVASRHDLKLRLRVLPPWHGTWWFRGLLSGVMVLLVFAVVWVRVSVLRRRNRQLSELVASRTQQLASANEALRTQSLTDPLTGLRNRRFLDSSMPEWVATVQRQQRAIARGDAERAKLNVDVVFIMLDIDHFKQVNDQHGHQAGDRVLHQFGDILRAVTRSSDSVARWGGEEFLIVARNAARADAASLAERIRKAVAEHGFDIGGGKSLGCTCSLGFSVFPLLPDDDCTFGWEQIVAIADACLYVTKHNGRNAWVGIVPLAKPRADTPIPHRAVDIVRSGCFVPVTSIDRPIRWSSDGDE